MALATFGVFVSRATRAFFVSPGLGMTRIDQVRLLMSFFRFSIISRHKSNEFDTFQS